MEIMSLLPKNLKQLSLDEQKSWLTLLFSAPFSILINAFWPILYNMKYGHVDANPIFYFCLFLNLFSILFFIKRNYLLTAHFITVPCLVNFTLLIYLAGGVDAPGLFWLAALPVFFSVFYPKKGAIYGSLFAAFLFAGYLILDNLVEGPNLVRDFGAYKEEKILNFILFFLLTSFYYINYTIQNNNYSKVLEKNKTRIENLLRILIHDIASPLTIIRTRIMLFTKKPEDTHHIERIKKAADNAVEQIESIRQLKALEDGKTIITPMPIKVIEIIEEFIEMYSPRFEEKGISIIRDFEVDESVEILFDKNIFMNQILGNVLGNAIKFSHPDSKIRIHIFENNKTSKTKKILYIAIRDYGIGMPNRIKEEIFELDSVTSRPGTSGESGTGYGMPIMKTLIMELGGNVEIESVEKCDDDPAESITGTCFTLKFKKVT